MISLNDVLLAMSNIPVDDPIAEIWGRGLQGGHEIIEYTGTLPITINADGSALLDYRIYGNTVQTGTPTPENPITPEGVGERTGNLFSSTLEQGTTGSGGLIPSSTRVRSGLIYLGTGQFTFSCANDYDYQIAVDYHLSDGTYSSGTSWLATKTFELTNQTPVVRLKIKYSNDSSILPTDVSNIMLNLGSTALPYEPYGYKLPLTSAGQTVPIYLGEVETTRRIKKLVLTGEEKYEKNYIHQSTNYLYYAVRKDIIPGSIDKTPIFCNELPTTVRPPIEIIGINSNSPFPSIYFNFGAEIMNAQPSGNTAAGLKEYLAAQYAAGTPVTIWYVLAEPETDIVNEPLMKIGDYADTLSMEQADVSIPTFASTTVIDYDGTPKPEKMYIKYRR